MKRLLLLSLTALLAACNQNGGEIEGVKSFKFEGGAHKPGRLEYAQRPPAGGEHNMATSALNMVRRPEVRAFARRVVGAQTTEIQAIDALLRGRQVTPPPAAPTHEMEPMDHE